MIVFSSLKNELNSEEDWLVVGYMTETLMISTEEKNPTRKKWEVFRSNVGKKEYTLVNKTETLTEKKTV